MANTIGNKYGGGQKGGPNRMTKELRVLLKDIIHQDLKEAQKEFSLLEPKQRVELIIKLMPIYCSRLIVFLILLMNL